MGKIENGIHFKDQFQCEDIATLKVIANYQHLGGKDLSKNEHMKKQWFKKFEFQYHMKLLSRILPLREKYIDQNIHELTTGACCVRVLEAPLFKSIHKPLNILMRINEYTL